MPLLDTFTEAALTTLTSHTSDSGHTWSRAFGTTGSCVVDTNGALRGGSLGVLETDVASWTVPAWAHVTFRNTAATSLTGMRAGFLDTNGQGYMAFWGPATANGNIIGLNLRKNDGTGGDVMTASSTGTTGSKWIRLEKIENGDGNVSLRVLASPGGTGTAANVIEVIGWQTRTLATDGVGSLTWVGVNNAGASFSSVSRIQIDELSADALTTDNTEKKGTLDGFGLEVIQRSWF